MKTMFELSSLLYFKAGDNLCCLWPSVSADESWLTVWLVLILPWSLYSFHVHCSVYSRFLHHKVFEAFFCFGHSIWFGLNWQWYCAIIELSWRFIKAEVWVSNFTCYCALPECSHDWPIRFFVSLMNSNTSVVD